MRNDTSMRVLNFAALAEYHLGDYWRKMRRIVHHAMSQRAVESYTPLIEIESIETMRQLFDATIDPEGSFHRGTLGVIHTVIYGKRLETSDDLVVKDLLKYILDTFQVIGKFLRFIFNKIKPRVEQLINGHFVSTTTEADAVVNLLPFLQCLPIGLDKKAKKIMDGYFSLTKKLFDKFKEDKKCGITQPCVAEYILEHMEEEGIDDFDVHNLFIDLFGGGLDTSAVTLSWITAILALHPIVQERAHAELDAMVGRDRLPNQADEANLPFIRAIIREVLRFRPPIGWLNFPHQSVQDDTYEGYHIPADTSIVINVHAMHMDSSRWTHPERFDPDRYLDMTESIPASANGPIAKRDNMAFGWGRRMCPGIFLAEAELFMGTALLLWSYRIEVEKGGKAPNINEWQSGIVMRPKPYKVSFIPRHDKVKELIFA
ncbi:hypothetical protein BC938DRAFT_474607 [Jimgerdemannia flammicorona]|uniref:Cytochrome P450 n=1 Tax=Jimgerdemannia flammicorona TaxID=994334 RepID=A0A433QSD2_9FUNG|nr:hypothetical protein BC938DRAFT_474607 [Jimgerdemannia flammicorona]